MDENQTNIAAPKYWWESRTIWVQVVAALAVVATKYDLWPAGLTQADALTAIMGVMGALTVVLRVITKAPVASITTVAQSRLSPAPTVVAPPAPVVESLPSILTEHDYSIKELQAFIGVTPDGVWGPLSGAALMAKFTNLQAPALTDEQRAHFANRLGCSMQQLMAVANVESAGSGWDKLGRPIILFERHIFHRLTSGKWTPAPYSMPTYGGYNISSWDKLLAACGKDPKAAFAACSWGKFQVMGANWADLGYPSSFAMAYSAVEDEENHYEVLARFIEHNHLQDELKAIGPDPANNVGFAKAYNGTDYARNHYPERLADYMKNSATI